MRTTVSLDSDLASYVDDWFASDDISNAQAIRNAVQHSLKASRQLRECRERVDELEEELEQREAEIERMEAKNEDLQRQLAAANQRIDLTNDLVENVEAERSLQERRAQAGILQRAKWWFTGMDREKDD